MGGAACASCAAPLSAGAKFCHRCGLAAGAPARAAAGLAAAGLVPLPARPDRAASILPWGVAFVALLALAAMAAGKNFGAAKGSGLDGSANALPQASLGEVPGGAAGGAAGGPFAGGGAPGGPAGSGAPNLANMTPREIADRLYNRVMMMSSQGKSDSAAFFAAMALQNYEAMGAAVDLDQRYDMGRIAEVAGRADVARAQADTILEQNPTHLLGLVLATRAAEQRKDAKALADFRSRLLAAERAGERQQNVAEYQRHAADIDDALAAAKR